MDLEVAAVDPVVVGDHHLGELDVGVLDRLQRSVQRLDDQVESAETAALELLELLLVALSRGRAHPNRPLT